MEAGKEGIGNNGLAGASFTPVIEKAVVQIPVHSREAIELYKKHLPLTHEMYADKYFLRTAEILKAEGLNPWVKAQVFVRQGPGEVAGVHEAIAVIENYSKLREHGGVIKAVAEGSTYKAKDALITLEGPIQDMVELETMYLGVLTKQITKVNDGVGQVDLKQAEERMRKVVEAAGGRPVSYFGARHWHYGEDRAISYAAHLAGAKSCSTDFGASAFDSLGVGTIPHALENIYAWKYGKVNAVVEATKAFDRVIDPAVPRIALIDYNNKEITDSIAVAKALGNRLEAVRVDTCGENVAQGGLTGPDDPAAQAWRAKGLKLPAKSDPDAKYWYGTGVTVTGVYALRTALDAAGYTNVKIILTSGFGSVDKVNAFVKAEEALKVRLFDSLGVGGIFKPCRTATMDIVGVGTPEKLERMSKVGRYEMPNNNLKLVA